MRIFCSFLLVVVMAIGSATAQAAWEQQAKLSASDGASNDQFATEKCVDADGSTVIVGAPRNGAGAAYIYESDGAGGYTEKPLTGAPIGGGGNFGNAVSISGSTAAVGARYDSYGTLINRGSVHMFDRDGSGNWTPVAELGDPTGTSSGKGSAFGNDVALQGDRLAVGGAGRAFVFDRNPGTGAWSQTVKIAVGTTLGYGAVVDLDGDMLAVTDYAESSYAGAVYLYGRNEGGTDNWGQVAKLTTPDTADGSYFGKSVALLGDTLVVGEPANDSYSGAVYIYDRNEGGDDNWGLVQTLLPDDTTLFGEYFGSAVALFGDQLAIGADSDRIGEGASEVVVGKTFIYQMGDSGYELTQTLIGEDTSGSDHFGGSLAMTDGMLAIGNGYADGQGAAYVFTAPVPEPASLALLGLGGIALLKRRRR